MKALKKSFDRDPNEANRTATPLELFFDLVYVVAVTAATGGLHQYLGAYDIVTGISWYLLAFFAIWWCWMNFTWYASAFDADDVYYKLITFLQIFGALVMAVGIANFFKPGHDRAVGIAGYVIMRIAMVIHWVRAGRRSERYSAVCYRYAAGIAVVQFLWVVTYFLPENIQVFTIIALGIGELSVPYFAEQKTGTPWHPHHIAERYGCMLIIVLGEGVAATTLSVSSLINSETRWQEAFPLGFGAVALVFALWWSYFKTPWGSFLHRTKNKTGFAAFLFGYGHYFVFAALAAVGVALQLVADATIQNEMTGISAMFAINVLSVAVWIYLLFMSFYRILFIGRTRYNRLAALAALILPFFGIPAIYAGMPLQWSIFFTVIAPVNIIILNSYDDMNNASFNDLNL